MPITLVHLSFTYWWQEFHDHIFSVPMHPICFELMPDFQPVSEVTCLSPFYICFQSHSFLLIRIHYFFCRIQYLPLGLGQFLITLQAQSLP
jgi:hypothetical protein